MSVTIGKASHLLQGYRSCAAQLLPRLCGGLVRRLDSPARCLRPTGKGVEGMAGCADKTSAALAPG